MAVVREEVKLEIFRVIDNNLRFGSLEMIL